MPPVEEKAKYIPWDHDLRIYEEKLKKHAEKLLDLVRKTESARRKIEEDIRTLIKDGNYIERIYEELYPKAMECAEKGITTCCLKFELDGIPVYQPGSFENEFFIGHIKNLMEIEHKERGYGTSFYSDRPARILWEEDDKVFMEYTVCWPGYESEQKLNEERHRNRIYG